MKKRGIFSTAGLLLVGCAVWGSTYSVVAAQQFVINCTVEWPTGDGAYEQASLETCIEPFQEADSVAHSFTLYVGGRAIGNNSEEVIRPEGPTVLGTLRVSGFDLEKYEPEFKYAFFSYDSVDSLVEIFTGSQAVEEGRPFDFPITEPIGSRTQYLYVTGFKKRTATTTDNPAQPFYLDDSYDLYQTPFTLDIREPVNQPEPAEPTVMFLPGIMGSRLYADDAGCGNDSEYELWFSRDECEQLRLQTKFTGESEHDVYTKASEQAVIDEILVRNLYQDWLATLATWEEEGDIAAYAAVPYDWRLRLDHILQTVRDEDSDEIRYEPTAEVTDSYLYQELERLADAGGEVTIVTHSNGGLVAKQLLQELEERDDPLLDQVSELVLVGVPQTGAPSSVVGLLHGLELGNGWVAQLETTRQIMNTAPFAHHLLPTEAYFASIGSGSVIDIASGSSTTAWRDQFGGHIEEVDVMYDFLSNTSGRTKPESQALTQPEVVDPYLLQYAATAGAKQAAWQPPAGIEVVQITGVGVPTPGGLQYFTDTACVQRGLLPWRCAEHAPKVGYRVPEVDGDGTVVRESAAFMDGAQITDVSAVLADVNDRSGAGLVHNNFMEMAELHDRIAYRLGIADEPEQQYLLPDIDPVADGHIVYRLHSPVDLVVRSAAGQAVSSSTEEIEGSHYRRYGEVQQIRVPAQAGPFTAQLHGTGYGSFTLEIERQEGYEVVAKEQFTAVPVATGTWASLNNVAGEDGLVTEPLQLDYDSDGVVEVAYRPGELVAEPVATGTATTTSSTTGATDAAEETAVPATDAGVQEETTTTGTRVRAPASPAGEVAGVSTQADDRQDVYADLHAALGELKKVLDRYEEIAM